MGRVLTAAILAILLVVIIGPRFIALLRRRGIGQSIRKEGPARHQSKAGTPTMGGLLILVSAVVPYLLLGSYSLGGLLVLGLLLGSAFIGFLDDSSKLLRKRSLGISGKAKMALQLMVLLVVGWVAYRFAGLDTSVSVPLVGTKVELGWFYILLAYLVVSGTANTVNLTDGLDGLAAGTVAIALLAYTGIAWLQGDKDLAILSASLMGGCVGFLWYNSFPAAIFMGDTGALALGAALGGLAIMTGTELYLPLIGAIFVIEGMSLIIQVIAVRVFHRRVFLMSPIHHHFELKNWSETKIIVRFWIVTAIFAASGFALHYLESARGVLPWW
ncbi:MAG: phospho-N-acetylmuramoyl-pentapeptide-transferase [Actinobacteria bacterium]|nr:phospho-N-acetylmuramoyl-pentapeptide-transferase [Actinomycetota bacterium]